MTDARTLTLALGGTLDHDQGSACCPAHDDRNASLSIGIGHDGRPLLYCHAGCAFVDVLGALREMGLLDGQHRPEPPSPAEIAPRRAKDEAEAIKRERQALACWNEAASIHGTLAEAYLRGARGITCPLPDTLRFNPACWHLSAQRLPALVVCVDGLRRLALHRTYLRADGSGKADVEPNKAMLGATRGGALRARRGSGTLAGAKGIETALSLCCGLVPETFAVWAALSRAGMAGLRLPQLPRRLLIAVDGDDTGRSAAEALGRRAAALGWKVQFLHAPEKRDFNDVLLDLGTADGAGPGSKHRASRSARRVPSPEDRHLPPRREG